MRSRLAALLGRLVARLLARPRTVVAVWIVLCVLLALVASRVRIDGRVEALVPEEDRHVAEYLDTLRRLGVSELVHVDVAANSSADLERAAALVSERLRASGLFRDVFGQATPEALAKTYEVVARSAPLLLDAPDYAEIEARLRPDALADRMDAGAARLLEPGGTAHEARLRRDPLDIAGLALRRVIGDVAGGAGGPVSADGRHALVVARAAAPMGDETAGAAIDSLIRSIARETAAYAEVDWIGGHRFYRSNAATLQTDIGLVSAAGMFLLVVVVVIGFPGWRNAFLALAASGVAGLFGLAAAVLVYGPLSGVALGFGSALAGICVDYVLHLHALPRAGESRDAATRRVFVEVGPSVVVGAASSAAAFLLLVASPVAAHRQIGVASAAGIVGALLFALTAGPILVVGRGRVVAARAPRRTALEVLNTSIFRFVLPRARACLAAAVAIVLASAALLPQLGFDPDMRRFESKDAETVDVERRFTATWGAVLARTLVVSEGNDVETALSGTEDALATLPAQRSGGLSAARLSATTALPSQRTQEVRWLRWTAFWDDARRARFTADLADAVTPLGMKATAFSPFLDGLGTRPPAIVAQTLDGTALASLVDRHLLRGGGGGEVGDRAVRSVAVVPSADVEDAGVRAALTERGALVLSARDLGNALVEATRGALARLALPAVGAVVLLLALYYRSVRRAAAAMFPLFGGMAVSGAVLVLPGEPLSLMNLPVIVPMLGFSVDYGVFLLDAMEETRTHAGGDPAALLGVRAASIMGAALTTAVGGIAMLLATHPAVKTLGFAFAVSVVGCGTLAWLAMPALSGVAGRKP